MATTRFNNGITNNKSGPTKDLIVLDPTNVHSFFEDFNYWTGTNWITTTTEAGSGAATETLADEFGGVLLLTNDNADNDNDFVNKRGESFTCVAGKKLHFKARIKVNDATQSDFVIGLQILDTSPLDVSDGIFFQKDDGDANLDFHVEKNGVSTSATAIHTVVDDTYIVVGFVYDGLSKVEYFIDGVHLGTSVVTNIPDDEELTISFGIQNGEAVIKTMSIDYVFVSQER